MKRFVLSAFLIVVICPISTILLAESKDMTPPVKKTKALCEYDVMRCLPPPKKYKNPDEAIIKGLTEICREHMIGHWNDTKLECESDVRLMK